MKFENVKRRKVTQLNFFEKNLILGLDNTERCPKNGVFQIFQRKKKDVYFVGV